MGLLSPLNSTDRPWAIQDSNLGPIPLTTLLLFAREPEATTRRLGSTGERPEGGTDRQQNASRSPIRHRALHPADR
jgi:hypothetical protein